VDLRPPKKVECCECGKPRERMRPVTRLADGWICYVCPQCWKLYDYGSFFFKIPEPVN
jgi:hypothetical protein